MYNPHEYARQIEKILHLPYQTANEIEHDPLKFLDSFLDSKYDISEQSRKVIDTIDSELSKYKGHPFCEWDEEDSKKLIQLLRIVF